ncbi:MAG TPA: hypothetical protein VN025_02645 [Candidatus Dormibacteraeota bacterium]|nr:hypothetical protein [Candidatus Dormibacteraeota bacterium]
MRIALLLMILAALLVIPAPSIACSCVPPLPEFKTPLKLAELAAEHADAVFEGTVSRAELKWNAIEAQVGDLVSASMEQDYPHMLVSFDAPRFYRGKQPASVQVRTGLGGGDCGYRFEVGKRYLVYAYSNTAGELATGICSDTALIEDSEINLQFLRGEPIVSDARYSRRRVEPGTLCGRAIHNGLSSEDGQVYLFNVAENSPVPSDEADLDDSGSFCATDLTPGKYRLLLVDGTNDAPTAFAFLTNAGQPADIATVEVTAGRSNPLLTLEVPIQNTFSITGKVQLRNASTLPEDCRVFLLNADHELFVLSYSQNIGPNGSFTIPRVISGKYWAFVEIESDNSLEWQTKKMEVEVTENIANLSLQLVKK